MHDQKVRPLTNRQREVLALMCEGLPNKLIGRRLAISCGTVKVHASCVFRALRVRSRVEAVLYVHRNRLSPALAANPTSASDACDGSVFERASNTEPCLAAEVV